VRSRQEVLIEFKLSHRLSSLDQFQQLLQGSLPCIFTHTK